jgi:hypothetical protein
MNIYYDPEKFGLTTVGEVELSSGSYEFDLFVVWQDSTGRYLWGQDSGCSCPSPFESHGVEDLDSGTAHDAAAAIQKALANRHVYYNGQEKYGDAEAVELIDRIMRNRPPAGETRG